MDLLRFATAGSVDDGKSTLIGRLLLDSKSIFEDQLEAVEATSLSKGYDYTDLALLTDGLRSEREQGITIDVAYRYFATPTRKFIIADTPGHIQYTRNMVTGASTADLGRHGGERVLREADQVDLVDGHDHVRHAKERDDGQVATRLLEHALASVDEHDDGIRSRRARDHVARVLHVAGAVGEDERPLARREVPVRHIDRDALLPLGAQAVGEQREVEVAVREAALG